MVFLVVSGEWEEVRWSQLFFSAVRTPNCSGVRLSCSVCACEQDGDVCRSQPREGVSDSLRVPAFLRVEDGAG